MALTEQTGPTPGVQFMHASDSGGGQVPVLALSPGTLSYHVGAKLGVQFIFATDSAGNQVPVVALHPDSGGTGPGPGGDGDNGWTPVLAVVSRGNDMVLRIADWAGGSGTKPATGAYLGASGLVVDIGDAQNIRGAPGANGTGPTKLSYSVFVGATPTAAQIVAGFIMPVAVAMNSADFTVHVETAATSPSSALHILLNGTKVGSISATGVVTIDSNPQAVPAGGRITFRPPTADATWGGITIGASHTKT